MRTQTEFLRAMLTSRLILCLLMGASIAIQARAEDDPNSDNSKNNKKDSDSNDFDPGRGFGLAKPKSSKNKDADLTPDQLREKTLKQMKEQQDKALKEQAKWEKKQRSKKPAEGDPAAGDSDGIGDGINMFTRNGRGTTEVGNERDSRGNVPAIQVPKNGLGAADQPHAFEMKGPRNGKNAKDSKVDGLSVELDGNPGDFKNAQDFKRSTGGAETIGEQPAPKKGFFARLFGSKKKEEDVKSGDKGSNVNMGTTAAASEIPHSPAGTHDTVVRRVEAELARKRLQEEMEARQKAGPNGDDTGAAPADAKGEVVDLDAPAAPAPPELAAPPAETVNLNAANAKAAIAGAPMPVMPSPAVEDPDKAARPFQDAHDIGPATSADIKAASEYEYKKGLQARDVVAREAAYQRAAVERREDAIPFMLEEIRKNGWLAAYAPQYLAGIGKLTPEVEDTLIHALAGKEDALRRSSAEALGALRSKRAVQPLLLVLKSDKNYTCRSAYTEALGNIGDRSVIPALKLSMEDKTEVEFVRCRAALALARLGDNSGRAYLVTMLDSAQAAMQVMGLSGLVQLRDPETAGYLTSALESPYEEVWMTAVTLLPTLGPASALPVLRARLDSSNEIFRRRAALAMGYLGSEDAVPFIDRAVRVGGLQERIMGCELLGRLERTDRIPLLIEKLQDAHTLVRQAAAGALAHLNAKAALPALIEAARGRRTAFELPGGIRGAGPDVTEQLTMLSCVRLLRGEQGDLYLSTLPNPVDHSWPEVDRVAGDQSVELLKMYELVDVVPDANRPVGAVVKSPDGKELLVREGETVAGGFKVRDMALPTTGKDKVKIPGYVTLMRGDQVVRLIIGRPAEMDTKK